MRSPGQLSIDGDADRLRSARATSCWGGWACNALIQAAPNTLDMTQTYLGLYAQDTWRVGSKVTLNYGLR